jgi:hypothetical protein
VDSGSVSARTIYSVDRATRLPGVNSARDGGVVAGVEMSSEVLVGGLTGSTSTNMRWGG